MNRRFALKPPRGFVVIAITSGALAGLAGLARIEAAGGINVSFAPAILMIAGIMGGPATALIAAALFAAGTLLWHPSAAAALPAAIVAALCANFMRRGISPLVPTAAIASASAAGQMVEHGVTALWSWTPESALLGAIFNVAVALLALILLPRRAKWLLPRNRWRIEHALFVLCALCLAPVAVVLWSTPQDPAPSAALPAFAISVAGVGAVQLAAIANQRLALHLAFLLRNGRMARRHRASRQLQWRLPREAGQLFLSARRISDGLHRRVRRQALQIEIARWRELSLQTQIRNASRLSNGAGFHQFMQELKRTDSEEAARQVSRERFLATMSHEIRTPLHGLMGTLDMLRSEALTQEGRRRLEIARTSAKSLVNIANDILDLSRIDAGRMALDCKPLHLERVIRDVVEEMQLRAESSRLTLHVRTASDLPAALTGDAVRIKQILRNLLSNALKFTSAGGVTVHARYTGGQCVIDVTDTGEGIPEDKRECIFEPFVQGDSASSRRFGGAGLGLAISRKLAEAMNGSLVLLRSDHTGSTFRLMLPLPVSDEPPVDDQSHRLRPLICGRVLVVEDDEASRYVAQTLLESLKCPTRIASGGSEALELVRNEEFDLVLMDCEMPLIDGYETARRMRAMLRQRIPIVAMTASVMASDRERCLAAGMDDVLPKPFNKSTLSDLLGKWLSNDAHQSKDMTLEERVAAHPPLDAKVFDELWASLRWQVAPLRNIYRSFRELVRETTDLLDVRDSGAPEAASRKLHSLQGSAALCGARQIEQLAAWLGEWLRTNQPEELAKGVELLRKAFQGFEQEIERRMELCTARRR